MDIVEDNKYEKDDKKKDDKKKDDKKKDGMQGEGDSTKVDSNDSPPRLEVHFYYANYILVILFYFS